MKIVRRLNYFFWLRNNRKYQRLKDRLANVKSFEETIRLNRKKKILRKKISNQYKKWTISFGLGLLFLSYSLDLKAQDTISLNNSSRVQTSSIQQNRIDFAHIDFNGDGFKDYVGKANGWRAYVLFGDGILNPDSVDVNNILPGDGIYIMAPSAYEFANKITTIPDINGDGFGDIAMFDFLEKYGSNYNSFVLFGGSQSFPDTINLDSMTVGDGLEFVSNGSYWGEDLVSGDINGDGISDLALGTTDFAQIEVMFGKPNGFAVKTIFWDTLFDGNQGFKVREAFNTSFEYLGKDISIPGDINNDGYDDLIMLAGYDTFGRIDTMNWVYGLYGKSQMDSLIISDSIKSPDGFRIDFKFGDGFVGSGGDLNGDQYDDFFITPKPRLWAPIADSNSYVIYGSCNPFPDSSHIQNLALTGAASIPVINLESIEYTSDFTGDLRNDLLLKKGNVLYQIKSDSVYFERTNLVDTACQFYNFNGKYLNQTGSYLDTLSSAKGCDSIVSLNLLVNSIDTLISQNGATIYTTETGDYQWIDCSSNTIINGETDSTFTPVQSGNYAVEILKNNCLDTTNCINILVTGLEGNEIETRYMFFPNPVENKFRINHSEDLISVQLISLKGEILENWNGRFNKDFETEQNSGIYILKVRTKANQTLHFKIVIR